MWKDALKLLDDMRDNNVLPNQYTYSSAITACGNCGKWKQSLDLLKQVRKDCEA
jgi:pentatricopeptide repeat domain-containing protein 1